MRKCLWSIYLSLSSSPSSPLLNPVVFHSCASRCNSDNIFPVRYSTSPGLPCPGVTKVECLAIHTCFLRVIFFPSPPITPRTSRRIAKGFFLLAREASKFRGTEGSAKLPIRPSRRAQKRFENRVKLNNFHGEVQRRPKFIPAK